MNHVGKLSMSTEALMVVKEACRKANVLCSELLDLAADKNASNSRSVDLNTSVRNSLLVYGVFGTGHHRIDFLPCIKQVEVAASQSEIDKILGNLLTNAVDAVGEINEDINATITIGTDVISIEGEGRETLLGLAPGRYASITVWDRGTGILADDLSKIFDPFFTTKTIDGGTGLGLVCAMDTVKALGGTITVASEQGCGSVFTVYLPETHAGG
jgi:signal transduction histidine kinase